MPSPHNPPQFEPWHLLLIVYCFTHYSLKKILRSMHCAVSKYAISNTAKDYDIIQTSSVSCSVNSPPGWALYPVMWHDPYRRSAVSSSGTQMEWTKSLNSKGVVTSKRAILYRKVTGLNRLCLIILATSDFCVDLASTSNRLLPARIKNWLWEEIQQHYQRLFPEKYRRFRIKV